MGNMASGNTRQWRSTTAKLQKADLDAIRHDFNTNDASLLGHKKSGVKVKSRKDLRKEKREENKAKQNAFWMKKRGIEVKPKKDESKHKQKKKRKKKKKKVIHSDEVEENEAEEGNAEDLLSANQNEDRLIASLEKKLGMKKRKNLPSKFKEDGLDYLLEICEPIENPALFIADDDEEEADILAGNESASDDEPEVASSRSRKRKNDENDRGKKALLNKHAKTGNTNKDNGNSFEEEDANQEFLEDVEEDLESEEEDDEEEENNDMEFADTDSEIDDDERVEEDNESLENEESDEDEINDASEKNIKDAGFELTGTGKDVENSTVEGETKYVPPHLRKFKANSNSEVDRKLERLKKQLKGLVNRLSEANLARISQEIEEIYSKHSKNDTNNVLSKLLFDACIMPTHAPLKMLMEHMMLVSILHSNIGNEVGAFFIQSLVEKFHELHSDADIYLDGKECDNALIMIAQLYNFKVVDSLLMYDLIRELVKNFTERDIEMLMLLLKCIGPGLRRDDPASLKEIILEIQVKAATCSDLVQQSRVRFMLDVINALRNNNLRKIPQYDPSLVENARKQIKVILRNRDSTGDIQLRVSLNDLLQAKNKGRWWVVGSAWAGRNGDDDENARALNETTDDELLKLAKQQRMNTDIRKNIFCVIMSSEDYIDCFEKLLKLNLKDKQAREIVHVLIDCCLQEKMFNPYYAYLAQKLCEFSRSNQVTFQYSFWDRFKLVSSSSSQCLENLANLIAHLFASNALSISILKVVGFATIDKASVRFFMRLFTLLLTQYPESTMKSVFGRIAPLQKLALLREGLKIFLRHFLLSKGAKSNEEVGNSRLKELVEIAEAALDGREVIKF